VFIINDPETFWLNATNIVLGVVTLVCIAAMATGLYQDVKARVLARRTVPAHADDHAFVVPALGLTMADGGERVDEKTTSPAPRTPNGTQQPRG
jgi:hypothetical protein